MDDTPQKPSYTERLAEQYKQLASLPFELAPPSRPTSPTSEKRSAQLQAKIVAAVMDAESEPSNPRWGHVTRLVRMAATSRLGGAAPGIRVGEKSKVNVGDYKFMLPDTAEEWEECERRWEARKKCTEVETGKGKGRETKKEKRRNEVKTEAAGKLKAPCGRDGKQAVSRYWTSGATEAPAASTSTPPGPREGLDTKAARVKDMVRNWQAGVVHEPPDQLAVEVIIEKEHLKRKEKQSPLEFPTVKRAVSSTAGKPGQDRDDPKPVEIPPKDLSMDVQSVSPKSQNKDTPPSKPSPIPIESSGPIGITDLSEAVSSIVCATRFLFSLMAI